MDNRRSNVALAVGRFLAPALLLLYPASASAHKLFVFAQVEGGVIHGRAYFPGDVPARRSEVIARDASGRELGRTTTDDDGKFTFTTREHVDYYLVAQTADGHGGQYTIHASELPDSLPAGTAQSSTAVQAVSPAAPADEKNASAPLEAQVAELRKQIQELRQQIYESDEHLHFRDILGGIGFILGLAGVAFYMSARRSKISPEANSLHKLVPPKG
jgi:nickel transport protein